ncbi:MAG: ferrous iron transporter B [Myxococcales bacterium]|nr:ferrous iron transporter B [Myxococcales bacterium]
MRKFLIISTPNSGKSLLFNRLTGLQQKVANFPGITVDICSGHALHVPEMEVVDFPGVYSLEPLTAEEKLSVESFYKEIASTSLSFVMCVLDATRLEQGLYFGLQVLQACQMNGLPVLFVVNMLDVIHQHKLQLDIKGLEEALGAPVLAISARTGEGLEALEETLKEPVFPKMTEASDIRGKERKFLRERSHELAHSFGPQGDLLIKTQTKLDSVFLHSKLGYLAFFIIMYLLFQSIFTWAAPVMNGVKAAVAWLGGVVIPVVPEGVLRAFVKDAIFGGFGAFLVFVPQIFVLTLVVGILEDSGYLARAAVICHKPLRFFGLTGKSFVPMLSGVACAIPGIYAARTIDSPRKRWLTYFAIPLMPCTARLPVYALLIAAFIPAKEALGGFLGLRGLVMFLIYLFGIVVALLVTSLLSRAKDEQHKDLPFVLEMPAYRLPSWRPLLRNAYNRSKHFVTQAGPVIFTVTVLIWVLGYFPNQGKDLSGSWLGAIGKGIEPVFSPIGLDWRYGIAIITSFAAREVFVGTLGTIYSISDAADHIAPLAGKIQSSGVSLASGIALIVFFAIAMQCISTLAILRKESGSWKLPTQIFVGYSLLAYVMAFSAFHIMRAFGG